MRSFLSLSTYNERMKAVITPQIASNLHLVGDRWTLLILRDLFLGRNRFEALQANTGAGRATLSRRLLSLAEGDMVRKSLYSAARYEYQLTEKGSSLFSAAMLAWRWELKYMAADSSELPTSLVHHLCGKPLFPEARCHSCENILTRSDVRLADDASTFRQQVMLIQSESKRRKRRQSSNGEDQAMSHIAGLVGDRWSILILVAMFFGMAKFDEFLQLLGIATNILGERLSLLVQYQVVTKQAYQNNPVRYRYLLTERGEDLYGFVMAVWQWAKTWTDVGESENGLVHNCGKPLVVDVSCGACSSSLSLV